MDRGGVVTAITSEIATHHSTRQEAIVPQHNDQQHTAPNIREEGRATVPISTIKKKRHCKRKRPRAAKDIGIEGYVLSEDTARKRSEGKSIP